MTTEERRVCNSQVTSDTGGFPLPPWESGAHAHCISEGKLQNQKQTHDPGLSSQCHWTGHETFCNHVSGCKISDLALASLGRAGAHGVVSRGTAHMLFISNRTGQEGTRIVWAVCHHLLSARVKTLKTSPTVDGRTPMFFLPWGLDIVGIAFLGFLGLY